MSNSKTIGIRRVITTCLTVAVASFGVQALAQGSDSISVKGSDTMVHLVTAWADAYMKSHIGKKVSVTGGGSGTGIAALLNGTTDICAASRDLNEEERKKGKEKGLKLATKTVARDALSIVVNPKNPIANLSLKQLEAIYTGEITNWKDVGGNDAEIVVTSRESSSGTYLFFQEHVLQKKDYTTSALLLPSTSVIVQTVADSEGAIGYVGLGYATGAGNKVKTVGIIKEEGAAPVVPSVATAKDGTYPVARPLYLVVSKEPARVVKEFLEFCVSTEGQKIVEDSGYVRAK